MESHNTVCVKKKKKKPKQGKIFKIPSKNSQQSDSLSAGLFSVFSRIKRTQEFTSRAAEQRLVGKLHRGTGLLQETVLLKPKKSHRSEGTSENTHV